MTAGLPLMESIIRVSLKMFCYYQDYQQEYQEEMQLFKIKFMDQELQH